MRAMPSPTDRTVPCSVTRNPKLVAVEPFGTRGRAATVVFKIHDHARSAKNSSSSSRLARRTQGPTLMRSPGQQGGVFMEVDRDILLGGALEPLVDRAALLRGKGKRAADFDRCPGCRGRPTAALPSALRRRSRKIVQGRPYQLGFQFGAGDSFEQPRSELQHRSQDLPSSLACVSELG